MLFPEHASHLDIYLIIIFSESLYLTKEPNSAVKLLLISGILYKPIPHLHTPFHPQILFILKFYVNSPYNKSCSCSGQRIPLSPIFLYLFLPVRAISQLGYIWLHLFWPSHTIVVLPRSYYTLAAGTYQYPAQHPVEFFLLDLVQNGYSVEELDFLWLWFYWVVIYNLWEFYENYGGRLSGERVIRSM